mmetsp:Transcript_20734/g.43668  ORF Transcript_20734/g.43668 Transcript_20734/m.43668 type:complete len:556 (-) Transcript_20734:86-1753(-)
MTSLLRRHFPQALFLLAICHILYIYTIDTPKSIYHCPLDRHGLLNLWTDENCYWSTTYADAREKFVSLGNHLKEQVVRAKNDHGDGDARDDVILDVIDVQSLSYDIAHKNFSEHIQSLEVAGVDSPQTIRPGTDTVDALLLTIRIPERGIDGENVDIIHSSGTHGIEGYLGSAVQMRFLHELFLRNEDELLKNHHGIPSNGETVRKVLLIHSVNPYGMRHHRRFNENNVGPNRNVLSDEIWSDVRERDPNIFHYVDMDYALNPFMPIDKEGNLFSWVDAARKGGYDGDMAKLHQRNENVMDAANENEWNSEQPAAIASLAKEPHSIIHAWFDEKRCILEVLQNCFAAIMKLGYTDAKRMLVAAQYHKPSGVYYGGGAHNDNMWENSIFAVQHAISELAGFEFGSSSSRAIWIDVHTGLGKFGDYSALIKGSGNRDGSPSSKDVWSDKFTSLLGRAGMGFGQSYDASVSAGYDQTVGFLSDSILCPPPHCFSIVQEFGTRPGIAVAASMILENKGFNSKEGKYNHLTSWAFYPQRLSWRRKTLRGGMDMLNAALGF